MSGMPSAFGSYSCGRPLPLGTSKASGAEAQRCRSSGASHRRCRLLLHKFEDIVRIAPREGGPERFEELWRRRRQDPYRPALRPYLADCRSGHMGQNDGEPESEDADHGPSRTVNTKRHHRPSDGESGTMPGRAWRSPGDAGEIREAAALTGQTPQQRSGAEAVVFALCCEDF